MPKNIFAYTETEYNTYPGYVSLNQTYNGRVVLSVRSKNSADVSEIELPLEQLKELAYSIANSSIVDL